MNMNTRYPCIVLAVLLVFLSCRSADSGVNAEEPPSETVTPVTVTHPEKGNIAESAEVNAVSAFLLKTLIKANANGYLQEAAIRPGDYVKKGQTLFIIKTKEATALGNTINQLDTSLHFHGTVKVSAPGDGYISQLSSTAGSYVQDGELLAEITDTRSFVFLLDLPYELKPYLPLNRTVQLWLPDSTVLTGRLQSGLPVVDSVSQTQRYIIRVAASEIIPENLIAKVRLLKKENTNSILLPKGALLSNETQDEFWIMQLINDSTAVKVPVQKGLETAAKVEIITPALTEADRILVNGNYGLPDTAKVSVVKSE